MELLGYIGAGFVGITLGLVGAGGSILILPILVYLLGISPVNATAYSLFIVGLTSIFGFLNYKKLNLVDIKTGLIFALPSLIGVFIARSLILPAIPDVLFEGDIIIITKDKFILIFFSIVMFLASLSMIKRKKQKENDSTENMTYNYPLIGIEGLLVGSITGLVGAGGGFLIIPALVVLAKIPMKKAIGTSLLIISIKSLLGLLGDYQQFHNYQWGFLMLFSGLSIIGIFVGSALGKKIPGEKLKPAFGYFVLVMAIYIIGREAF